MSNSTKGGRQFQQRSAVALWGIDLHCLNGTVGHAGQVLVFACDQTPACTRNIVLLNLALIDNELNK